MKDWKSISRSTMMLIICVSLIGLSLTACKKDDDNEENLTAPSLVQDCGEFFCYDVSETAGITITADFNQYHLAGQPYGNWVVKAEWRTPDNQCIVEKTVPIAIDASGIGMAHIAVDFLNMVFEEANAQYVASQDQSLWLHQPGLQLTFFPDDWTTWEYYDFNQ